MASDEDGAKLLEPVDSESSVNDDLPAPLIYPDTAQSSTPWRRLVTVEPALLILSVAVMLTSPIETTLYLTHTCRHLGFNESTCLQLEERGSEKVEAAVQGAANFYVMAQALIETCVPAVLTVFAGPWSDKHGRRTFLLLPVLGFAGKYATLATLSHWPALAPCWLLLAAIPASLGGGFVIAISMCFCYVSDVSSPQRRGFRMSMVEASFYVGVLAGTVASTHLFAAGGYLASYATASGLCVVAVAYSAFLLDESVANAEVGGCFLSGLLDWRLAAAMLSTCCQRRPGNRRAVLWLAMCALALSILCLYGELGVGFLFARRKFAWDIEEYTTFGAVNILLQIVCTVAGVWLLSLRLRLDDALLTALAFVPKTCSYVLLAISPASWWLYMASAVGALGALAGPLCRTLISKSVPPQDVGKAFSLVSALEAVTPLAAAPLYTLVYNETLVTFPGAYFLLSAGFFGLNVILIGAVLCLQDKTPLEHSILVNAD